MTIKSMPRKESATITLVNVEAPCVGERESLLRERERQRERETWTETETDTATDTDSEGERGQK